MRYTVKKQGKQWAVFRNGELLEGGFFTRDAADDECSEWKRAERQANSIDGYDGDDIGESPDY